MAKILEDLPTPNQSRQESYLGVIAGQEGAIMPEKPLSREEEYLEYIAEHGGGGGGEPAAYLKSIEKDETNKEVTITDKEGTETKFPYGSGTHTVDLGVLDFDSETPLTEQEVFKIISKETYDEIADNIDNVKIKFKSNARFFCVGETSDSNYDIYYLKPQIINHREDESMIDDAFVFCQVEWGDTGCLYYMRIAHTVVKDDGSEEYNLYLEFSSVQPE